MASIVEAETFLDDNFLSTDLRVPVTLLETNACSPLATVETVYPAVPGTGTPAPYMTLAEATGHIQQAKIPASSGITPQNVSSITTHAFASTAT